MILSLGLLRLIDTGELAPTKSSAFIKTKESVFINDEFICVPNLW